MPSFRNRVPPPGGFQARKFEVTGSRVSSLVGFHGRKDFTETWDIVINGKEQKDLSHIHNIKRGHDYEKEALNYFENLAKCSTAKCGFFKHPQDSLFGCSPDALGPSGILIEIKTRAVRSLTPIMGLSGYPHYYLQCQLQMDCTNAHSCVLLSYLPENKSGSFFLIKRNNLIIDIVKIINKG